MVGQIARRWTIGVLLLSLLGSGCGLIESSRQTLEGGQDTTSDDRNPRLESDPRLGIGESGGMPIGGLGGTRPQNGGGAGMPTEPLPGRPTGFDCRGEIAANTIVLDYYRYAQSPRLESCMRAHQVAPSTVLFCSPLPVHHENPPIAEALRECLTGL